VVRFAVVAPASAGRVRVAGDVPQPQDIHLSSDATVEGLVWTFVVSADGVFDAGGAMHARTQPHAGRVSEWNIGSGGWLAGATRCGEESFAGGGLQGVSIRFITPCLG
jgi:hypothetical protein